MATEHVSCARFYALRIYSTGFRTITARVCIRVYVRTCVGTCACVYVYVYVCLRDGSVLAAVHSGPLFRGLMATGGVGKGVGVGPRAR